MNKAHKSAMHSGLPFGSRASLFSQTGVNVQHAEQITLMRCCTVACGSPPRSGCASPKNVAAAAAAAAEAACSSSTDMACWPAEGWSEGCWGGGDSWEVTKERAFRSQLRMRSAASVAPQISAICTLRRLIVVPLNLRSNTICCEYVLACTKNKEQRTKQNTN